MTLRSYQVEPVAILSRRKRAMVIAPAGSGKTVIAAAALDRVLRAVVRDRKVKVGWLANTQEQCQQAKAALALFRATSELAEVKVRCAAAEQTWADRDVLIVDECFAAGTLIDGRPIETIKPGEAVLSYNHAEKRLEFKKVVRLFKSKAKTLCRVSVGGAELICTENHPFWDGRKYTEIKNFPFDGMASRLITDECLQNVRKTNRAGKLISKAKDEEGEGDILRKAVRESMVLKAGVGSNGGNEPEIRFRANEKEKPDDEERNSGKDVENLEGNRPSPNHSWRERKAANSPRNENRIGFGLENITLGCDEAQGENSGELSGMLQDRCCESCHENRDRGGRMEPRRGEGEGERCEERQLLEGVRLDSFEILKQTSDGEFGGVCPGGCVYNIEVEGNNNYFAGGVLVHNCHHASAPTWQAQIESCNGARWGFTATPESENFDAIERDRSLEELFAPVGEWIRVERVNVGSSLSKARVTWLDVDAPGLQAKIDAEISKTYHSRLRYWGGKSGELRAMVAWQMCIRLGIVENQARTELAIEKARYHVERGDSTLVLVNQVEHAQQIAEAIGDAMACYSGMGAKVRRHTLYDFKTGKLKCIVATSLADEGLDVPIASALVLVSGGKNKAKAEQRTGRVLRAFAGKTEATIYDFADTFHPLMRKHADARRRVYEKLGYL